MMQREEITAANWRRYSHAAMLREPITMEAVAVPDEAVAGDAVHLRLEYTPRGLELPDGSEIIIAPPRFWRKHLGMAFTELHSQFDTNTERHPGGSFALVRPYRPEGSDLRVDCELRSGGFYYLFHMTLHGRLKDGETLVLYMGDPIGPAAQVPKTAADHPLPTLVRFPDEEHFRDVAQPPVVRARGGTARRLRVRCPAVLSQATQMRVQVVAVDGISENPAGDYEGRIALWRRGTEPCSGIDLEHSSAKRRSEGILTTGKGQFDYVNALDEDNCICGRSNPVGRPEDFDGMNVYFGDIHVHAEPGDGFETASDAYEYGYWYSGLDFCAVTHQQNSAASLITQEAWERHLGLTEEYHEPGSFVTIPGFETYCEGGHRIAYFRSLDEARRFRVSRGRAPEYDLGDSAANRFPTPEDLWKALDDYAAITCVHHTRYIWPADWGRDLADAERCIEIWSRWGQNEEGGPHSAREALRLGHRLGFMASTDNQFAQPGNGPFGVNDGAACTGVLAPKLDREALFEGLKQRRCYATTGEKMLVNFTLDGEAMGSLLADYAGDREFRCVAAGTERLKSIELVRNNEIIRTLEPGKLTFADEICDEDQLEDLWLPPAYEMAAPFVFYYLRVTQVDGHRAWTSPIWISR